METQEKTSAMKQLQLTSLLKKYPGRIMWSLYVLINGFISIAVLALCAMVFNIPFIFPSLGPTAILLFLSPQQKSSSPRNVLYGHAIGILCGYLALVITGLAGHGSVLVEGVNLARVIAAALSLGTTGAFMSLFDVPHPPAGATTLIIALGLITQPYYLLIIEIAVALLVLQALIINKLAGIKYPVS